MTTREHFDGVIDILENSTFAEDLCSVYEAEKIEDTIPHIKNIYDLLVAETNKERGDQDFYGGEKEKQLKEYDNIYENIVTNDNLDDIKCFASFLYDALIVEKLRTYAYEVYLKGGINHYNQLASDLQDCYLDHLKEEGVYDEWRGSEYADIDCCIGDGLKLGE